MPNNEINNTYIDQIRKSLIQNSNSLQAVDNHVIELVKMLIPLIPQSSSIDRNANPFDAVFEEVRSNPSRVAHVSQPDFYGSRDLGELLGDCKERYEPFKTKKSPTPSNKLKLECLSRFLLQERGIYEEAMVTQDYLIWKAIARARTNRILDDKPELRCKTWPTIAKENPLFRLQMVLLLEADLRTFQLHRCINSWACEKLLWECFRNKSTQFNAKLKRNVLCDSGDVVTVNDANGGNGNFALEDAANVALAGDLVDVASTAGDGASNEETLEKFGYDFQDKNEYDNDSEEGDSYQYSEEECLDAEVDTQKDEVQSEIEDIDRLETSESGLQDENHLPLSNNSQIVVERRCSKRKALRTVDENINSYKVIRLTKAAAKANQRNTQTKPTKKINNRKRK